MCWWLGVAWVLCLRWVASIFHPLAEAMNALKAGGLAVCMTVQEPWYREQQVLPGRTHPTMVMNHGGGYLLSGTVTLAGTRLALAEAPPPPASVQP